MPVKSGTEKQDIELALGTINMDILAGPTVRPLEVLLHMPGPILGDEDH